LRRPAGNTGIALAFICAAQGYELVLTLPQGMAASASAYWALYGARFEITESLGGMQEAVAAAQKDGHARRRLPSDQFSNPRTRGASAHNRGPELWRHSRRVDVFVAGVGTGGRSPAPAGSEGAQIPKLHVVAVEPAGSAVLSGGRPGRTGPGIGAGLRGPQRF